MLFLKEKSHNKYDMFRNEDKTTEYNIIKNY